MLVLGARHVAHGYLPGFDALIGAFGVGMQILTTVFIDHTAARADPRDTAEPVATNVVALDQEMRLIAGAPPSEPPRAPNSQCRRSACAAPAGRRMRPVAVGASARVKPRVAKPRPPRGIRDLFAARVVP